MQLQQDNTRRRSGNAGTESLRLRGPPCLPPPAPPGRRPRERAPQLVPRRQVPVRAGHVPPARLRLVAHAARADLEHVDVRRRLCGRELAPDYSHMTPSSGFGGCACECSVSRTRCPMRAPPASHQAASAATRRMCSAMPKDCVLSVLRARCGSAAARRAR